MAISNVSRGMSTNYYKAAAFLLPTDHVAKKSNKRKMLLPMGLQGPRVVLTTVVLAYIQIQMKSMEP